MSEETSTLTPQQPVEAARPEKERPGSLAAEKAKIFEVLMLGQAKARWAESVQNQARRENCDDTFKADVMASGLTVELSARTGPRSMSGLANCRHSAVEPEWPQPV